MDIFDRMKYLIERESGGNVNNFCKKAGINPETVRSAINYKKSFPSYEVISKILLTYSWVNPDWLILGNEPMQRQDTNNNQNIKEIIERYNEKEDRLLSIIESQQKTIEILSHKIKNNNAPGETNVHMGEGA